MLRAVASVLTVVCKSVQQLPTILGPAVHRWKNVGIAVQTDPTVLRYPSAITEQQKFRELTGFKLCATTPNNTQ